MGSIEHKMGIKASPTCVMHYDGATGWLVGQPHRGLAAMLTMKNAELLFVGVQGLGIAEAAYQGAAEYAKDRLQGRPPGVGDGPARPILTHPDVRRMLLTIRGFVEAGRALAIWLALEMEKAARHPEPAARAEADGLVALLTPVIKAAFSDLGFEATDYLRFMALVALGWMWARMALHALALGDAAQLFHRRKLAVARFYMARLLPQTLGLEATISAGATTLMALESEDF